MNLKRIQHIVNSGHPNWQHKLLDEIADDPDAIPYLMTMLNKERNEKKELITELNFQLSRAHMALVSPVVNKDGFVQGEIKKFYETGRIAHCFNMKDV